MIVDVSTGADDKVVWLVETPWGQVDILADEREGPAFQECECGDYRWQHTGPEGRGRCGVCTKDADAEGCTRFRPMVRVPSRP